MRGKTRADEVEISPQMRDDLRTWATFMSSWNRREKWVQSKNRFVLGHDASGGGFGFVLLEVPLGFDVERLPTYLRPGHAFAGSYSARDVPEACRSIQGGRCWRWHSAWQCMVHTFEIRQCYFYQTTWLTCISFEDSRPRAPPSLLCCVAFLARAL